VILLLLSSEVPPLVSIGIPVLKFKKIIRYHGITFHETGMRFLPVLHNYSGLIPWATKAMHEGDSQLLHHKTSRRIGKRLHGIYFI
jgi:hypothetical protein